MRALTGQDKTAEYVLDRFERGKRIMGDRHQQWLETLLAIGGDFGSIYWGGKLINAEERMAMLRARRKDPYGEIIQVEHNFLLAMLSTMVGAATQNMPQPIVGLLRNDMEARRAQRIQRALLRYMMVRPESDWDNAEQQAISWALITGTGWLSVLWDRFSSGPTFVPERETDGSFKADLRKVAMLKDGRAVWKAPGGVYGLADAYPWVERVADDFGALEFYLAPSGQPITSDELVPRGKFEAIGDLVFGAPCPFDLFFEVCRTWKKCPGVTHRSLVTVDELVDVFGSKARRVEATASEDDLITLDVNDDIGDQEDIGKFALLLYRWEPPSNKQPRGMLYIVAGGHTMHKGPLPGGMMPLAPVYDTENPGSVLGWSKIRQAVKVQRNINAIETDRRTNIRMHSNPRLLAPEGSIDITRLPTDGGAIIKYKPTNGGKPDFLTMPAQPAVYANEPVRLQQVMEDGAGIHGVSQGDSSGIQSGRQAAVHQASDNRKWQGLIKSLARAVPHVCVLGMRLWRDYAPDDALIQVFGPNGAIESTAVVNKRQHLDGDFLVIVQASQLNPYNEEIRRQQLVELWGQGLITSAESFWRLYDRGPLAASMPTDEASRERAREEIELMLMGETVLAEVHEDHFAHIDEHLGFMRTPEYYRLPQQIRAVLTYHFQLHQQMMTLAQNPVLTGASPMAQIPGEGQLSKGQQNAPPALTAPSQATQPGLDPRVEAQYG